MAMRSTESRWHRPPFLVFEEGHVLEQVVGEGREKAESPDDGPHDHGGRSSRPLAVVDEVGHHDLEKADGRGQGGKRKEQEEGGPDNGGGGRPLLRWGVSICTLRWEDLVRNGCRWRGSLSDPACEVDGTCTDLIEIGVSGLQRFVSSMTEFNGVLMVSLWNGDLLYDGQGICVEEGRKGGHEIRAFDNKLWAMDWDSFRVYDEELDLLHEEPLLDFGADMEVFDNRACIGLSNGDLLSCDGLSACTVEDTTVSYNMDMEVFAEKLWLGQYDGHVYSCDVSGACTDHGVYCFTSYESDYCRISSLGVYKGRLVVGRDFGRTTAFDQDGNEVSAPWPGGVTQAGTVHMIGVFPEQAYCVVPECSVDADCDDGFGCTTDVCDSGTCVNTPDDGLCPADADCHLHLRPHIGGSCFRMQDPICLRCLQACRRRLR